MFVDFDQGGERCDNGATPIRGLRGYDFALLQEWIITGGAAPIAPLQKGLVLIAATQFRSETSKAA